MVAPPQGAPRVCHCATGKRLALERLDHSIRALLRVATYELRARPDVPTKTIISEYVDVADAFYAKREKGFVNGLLDAIAKDIRAKAEAKQE